MKPNNEAELFDIADGDTPVATKEKAGGRAVAKTAKPSKNLPVPAPTSVLEIIARIAADPNVDTDKMRAVIEIQRDTEAKQEFHDALLKLDAELPRINRDGKIELKGGKAISFASFENLNKIIKPILRQYGLRLNFQPDTPANGQGIVVHCHLTKGLYRESCTVPVSTAPASPAMNAQQSVGAAISYAKRYGAIALLNIETEAPDDRDRNGADVAKTISGAQVKQLLKAIDDCGIEPSRFMEKYKITAAHELPEKLFNEAIASLKSYGERAKGAGNDK